MNEILDKENVTRVRGAAVLIRQSGRNSWIEIPDDLNEADWRSKRNCSERRP